MNINKGDTIGFLVGGVAGYFLGKKFGPRGHALTSKVVGAIVGSIAGVQIGDKIYTSVANAQLPSISNSTTLTFSPAATSNQSVKSGTAVSFGVPAGGTMQNLTLDGQQVLGGGVAVYGPVTLAAGNHVINAQWTDSSGVTNQGVINLTVTP